MRGRLHHRGYTIVEVMIFLAISGFMFVMAAGFVQGKQAKSEFRQGMHSLNDQVRGVINDVGNGFFPSNSDFKCTADPDTPPQFDKLTTRQQGTNDDCVFMGKVLQFRAPDASDHSSDGHSYNVFTIAGRHYAISADDGTLPTNFTQAKPVAVYNSANGVDLTDKKVIEWNLRVTGMFDHSDGTTYKKISAVGFFGSFGHYTGSNLDSGSQNLVVIPIQGNPDPAANGNETEADMTNTYIAHGVIDGAEVSRPNIVVCLEGGDNQQGVLTIGGQNGQRLTTSIGINQTCPA